MEASLEDRSLLCNLCFNPLQDALLSVVFHLLGQTDNHVVLVVVSDGVLLFVVVGCMMSPVRVLQDDLVVPSSSWLLQRFLFMASALSCLYFKHSEHS